MPCPRPITLLGSTGSIGVSALEVVRAFPERLAVFALAARRSCGRLLEQAREFRPRYVAVADPEAAAAADWADLPPETELLVGPEALERVAADPAAEIVLAAIVGAAGLRSGWAAIEAGKLLALANKELLVMAGPLATARAKAAGATILPVDSEHSAVFQCLQAGRRADLRRVVLTASGGPFRRHTLEELKRVGVEEALAHPTWRMGRKITVDSATMMNKALEIIEARWLFDLAPEEIAAVVHPQSIVHSFVEFADGAVLAQLSPPDMRLPIQYAFLHPERPAGPAARLDWSAAWRLEFEPPDEERFPAVRLGHEAARLGGGAGAVLNAANETAVEQFLAGRIPFLDVARGCAAVLARAPLDPSPTLDEILRLDQWARKEMLRWTAA